MHISSVIKISFCRISFSGHQNKFCACLDSIYGSRAILVMCKNCSDISWHRLNLNQSKTNCPKNINSDGLIVREMGPWSECIFRSLLQFLVNPYMTVFVILQAIMWGIDSQQVLQMHGYFRQCMANIHARDNCTRLCYTLRLSQNCTFKFIFLYEHCCTLLQLSLKYVSNCPFNN